MSANLLQDDTDKQRRLPESGCCTQMDTEQLVAAGEEEREESDGPRERRHCKKKYLTLILKCLQCIDSHYQERSYSRIPVLSSFSLQIDLRKHVLSWFFISSFQKLKASFNLEKQCVSYCFGHETNWRLLNW